MTTIDQVTRRRIMRTGLTACDESRASGGYTLYAPMYGPGNIYLINREGAVIHEWVMPYPPGLYGYLLPNGNLFYLGKVRDETRDRFPLWGNFKGGIMMEVDWKAQVVWEHRDRDHHHDARRTAFGGAIYLTVERVPDNVAEHVQGGLPGSGTDGMWADVIVEVDSSGNRVWEWHAYEHLDYDLDVITSNDPRDEWTHANTVVPLGDDRVMISCRNISTVGIIDKGTGNFVWRLGYDTLAQQHDPSMLSNGNVLVYDNGAHRKNAVLPHSRVIEVNPTNSKIVWEYRDTPAHNFFSPYISGARRLPNGNTLITEGNFGRMFQVTPDKEVVWEFISPHFCPGPDGALSNAVFRSTHYLEHEIPNLR